MYFKEKSTFELFLKNKNLSENYIRDVLSNCDKIFSNIITFEDLIRYYEFKPKKYNFLAIRNFISYCDENETLSNEVILFLRKKIKKKESHSIDTYVPSEREIEDFVLLVRDYDILSYICVKILLESGLRISELTYFLENWDKNKGFVENNIFIYPLFHCRGFKNSYYLFLTKTTFDLFVQHSGQFKYFKITKLTSKIRKENLIPLKYLRKYHFTLMIQKGIEFEIANFIQGRASKNIGFNHYLAKKEIAIKEYRKLI